MCPAASKSSPPGKRPKPRDAGGDLIYGRHAVREALRGKRRVRTVYLVAKASPLTRSGVPGGEREERPSGGPLRSSTQSFTGAGKEVADRRGNFEGLVRSWLPAAGGQRPPLKAVSTEELTALVGSPEHQGVAAEVGPYPYLDEGEVLEGYTLLVALDEVQDPQNLGAVIRVAECAGAAVVLPRHRAAEVTPAVVKASAGATEHAAVARVRNLAEFLARAKKAGFWVYGAVAGADASYMDQDFTYPTCFVLGSEGKGLGRLVTERCDVLVSLPLRGKIESLNVSVTSGILLYETVRQRTAACANRRGGKGAAFGPASAEGLGVADRFPDEGG